jgi:DNA-directed RNA polymerase specialized sigma24 family protein
VMQFQNSKNLALERNAALQAKTKAEAMGDFFRESLVGTERYLGGENSSKLEGMLLNSFERLEARREGLDYDVWREIALGLMRASIGRLSEEEMETAAAEIAARGWSVQTAVRFEGAPAYAEPEMMQAPEVSLMGAFKTVGGAQPDITALLARWRSGDKAAENELMEALHPAMKFAALGALRSCVPGKLSLSATELVHETYLRLIRQRNGFENRAHFLAIAAHTLKRVILDLLKARGRSKRGDARELISLDAIDAVLQPSNDQPLDLIGFVQQLDTAQSFAVSLAFPNA